MTYVDIIISKFGGVRPLARAMGKTASTVSGWKSRGTIPDNEKLAVKTAANKQGLNLKPDDFFPSEEQAAVE